MDATTFKLCAEAQDAAKDTKAKAEAMVGAEHQSATFTPFSAMCYECGAPANGDDIAISGGRIICKKCRGSYKSPQEKVQNNPVSGE